MFSLPIGTKVVLSESFKTNYPQWVAMYVTKKGFVGTIIDNKRNNGYLISYDSSYKENDFVYLYCQDFDLLHPLVLKEEDLW